MKRFNRCLLFGMSVLIASSLVACSGNEGEVTPQQEILKVGMVTDAGTIDDKSFNQGTWEGIKRYEYENDNVEAQYVQPQDASTQSFLEAIDNLVLAGNKVVVTPGFSFEEAIGQAQQIYPDVKFILIDGQPMVGQDDKGQPIYEIKENTVSISFKEQEAGFLAGVASALESKTGKLAYLGGIPVPAVQKLGWGFVAGVAYANHNLGTNAQMTDYIYQGTFTETDSGRMIAGSLFDKGVDTIFAAAGAVGVGAIGEAKSRAEAGQSVYMVGVDVDQYQEGVISNGSSVMLTSAMKRIDQAAYMTLESIAKDAFPGGESAVMDATVDGIGLPNENPNLSETTLQAVATVYEAIKSGDVEVPDSVETLEAYLVEQDSQFEGLSY